MNSWREAIPYIRSGFCDELIMKTNELRKTSKIFPPEHLVLNALDILPFDTVKVVILGQDPYHGEGQAHGLSFSVPEGIKAPPSLKNIFKEIIEDIQPVGKDTVDSFSTDLTVWAKQGVLLLNACLTVEEKKPGSHKNIGWTELTDQIIEELSRQKNNVVFLLWGAYAISKKRLINSEKHLILEAPHPSPLSSYRGFFGCKHFSKTNAYLRKHSIPDIQW